MLSFPSAYAWKNVCGHDDSPKNYCHNVGKKAYNELWKNNSGLKDISLGKIVGVAWRPKGSKIGDNPLRVSTRDAYSYIIDDGSGLKPFIRQCREIYTQ